MNPPPVTLKDHPPVVIDWKDGLIALGMGIFSLFLYVRTLVPTLLPGDSGEFQTMVYTLGHAHTPGYEVYLLLAHLFTLLVPIGDMAYRVNLFSAVNGALTIALVYLIGRVISRSRWAGIIAAFALAISATFWSQAIIAEVYTAGSVFTSAILLLVLLWYAARRPWLLFAAGLLGGLAIEVHNTNSLFAPAIALLLLLCWKDLRRAWMPAVGGAVLGVALMVAAFAVIDANPTPSSTVSSIYQPSISRWGLDPHYMDTFAGRFKFIVFAQQWRSAMYTGDPKVISDNEHRFGDFLPQDFALPILLLIPLGLISLFVSRWRLGIFFTVAIIFYGIYTLNYRIGDIYVFFIALYVYFAPLIAEGFAVLLRGLARLPGVLPKIAQPALALVLILAAAPVYPQRLEALQKGELRFDFMNLDSNRQLAGTRALLSDTVKHLPKNAIILTDWTRLYDYYYLAEVEQGRNDLLFLETYPYSTQQGLSASIFPFMKENIAKGRPILSEQEIREVARGGLITNMTSIGTKRMYKIELP